MDLFFSPPVNTYSIIVNHHQAVEVIDRLVSTGNVQFQIKPYDDPTDPFYIIYSRLKQIKFKLLSLIDNVVLKYNEKMINLSKQDKKMIVNRMKDYIQQKQIDYIKYLDMQESIVSQKIHNFSKLSQNYDNLLFQQIKIQQEYDLIKLKLELIQHNFDSRQFQVLSGSCPKINKSILQRLIFRRTHGHSYIIFKNRSESRIKNKLFQKDSNKDLFLCFVPKGIVRHIGNKLINIFHANNATIYDLPLLRNQLYQAKQKVEKKIKQLSDLQSVFCEGLSLSIKESLGLMNNLEDGLNAHLIRLTFLQRIIYIICHSKTIGSPSKHHMITFHIPQHSNLPQLPVSLIVVKDQYKRRTILPNLSCLNQVNTLTSLYSVPKHNEIIPSVFMLSTVPILFGMMFSDMGHGLMLLGLSLSLKLPHLVTLMAFMSIYCGFIYNQFFGMKIISWSHLGVLNGKWGTAQNSLNFENSLKMKISMIIACVHMAFAGILKCFNDVKKGQKSQLYFDSFPKLILLIVNVGYLVYLIIAKWFINYEGQQQFAPSIINSMLQRYLGFKNRNHSIFSTIQKQKKIASLLNYVSLVCLLLMVYNHTFRNKFEHDVKKKQIKKNKQKYQYLQEEDIEDQMNNQLSKSQQNFSSQELTGNKTYYWQKEHQSQLGPLQVFQYILSLISSTTSYLRLFALSLAHAKLSHLLLTFLLSTLSGHHPSISILRCVVFFITTVGMMLILDVMQCLMHVVRLHWVQWMGKFYQGCGTLFKPQLQQNFD